MLQLKNLIVVFALGNVIKYSVEFIHIFLKILRNPLKFTLQAMSSKLSTRMPVIKAINVATINLVIFYILLIIYLEIATCLLADLQTEQWSSQGGSFIQYLLIQRFNSAF